jgi:hypothetical protein
VKDFSTTQLLGKKLVTVNSPEFMMDYYDDDDYTTVSYFTFDFVPTHMSTKTGRKS